MANSASAVRSKARGQRPCDGKALSHSLFACPQSHGDLGSREGIVRRKEMSGADVDGGRECDAGGRAQRGTDQRAANQEASQPACTRSSVIDWETASSMVLTGVVQYRSEPTRPHTTGNSFGNLSTNTCHYSDRPAFSQRVARGRVLVNSYRPSWDGPRNLDQKLIGLVGTGIISHPQPL